jgi:hypothetical protein
MVQVARPGPAAGRMRKKSGSVLDVLDVGDPVALSPREAGVRAFAIKTRAPMTKQRCVDIIERVDADDGVKMLVDAAGDHRHDSAHGAGVKFGCFGAESIFGHTASVADEHLQPAAWIGHPRATVFAAKSTGASTHLNFCRIGFPDESEGNVAAMTAAVDQHVFDVRLSKARLSRAANGVRIAETISLVRA